MVVVDNEWGLGKTEGLGWSRGGEGWRGLMHGEGGREGGFQGCETWSLTSMAMPASHAPSASAHPALPRLTLPCPARPPPNTPTFCLVHGQLDGGCDAVVGRQGRMADMPDHIWAHDLRQGQGKALQTASSSSSS